MAVCQFFLRGQCRFGEGCRNEHPVNPQQTFGNSAWTRNATTTTTIPDVPYTPAIIFSDLSPGSDKPDWPLSSYAPAKHEPLLISGLDESPDELRVKYVGAVKAGNLNEYLQYESTKIAAAEQLFTNARTNFKQTYDQALKNSTSNTSTSSLSTNQLQPSSAFPSAPSAFGSTTTTSAFGNIPTTSAFGSAPTTSAFGNIPMTSAFGSAPTTTSAFGNIPTTSAFGSTAPSSVFGAPAQVKSAFGAPATTSVFGSTTNNTATTTTSAFGQPAFGQPAFGSTGFGAKPAATSVFGSQPATTTSVFGGGGAQPTPTTTSAFGQPSFGQPSLGATGAGGAAGGAGGGLIKPASGAFSAFAGTGASAFGSPSTTTTTNNAAGGGGGFAAFAGPRTAFGSGGGTTPQQGQGGAGGSVFGAPSAFGQASNTSSGSVFGGGGGGGTTSVFGQPAFGAPTNTASASVFGAQQQQPALQVDSRMGTPGVTPTAPQGGVQSAFAPLAPIATALSSSVSMGPASAFPSLDGQSHSASAFGDGSNPPSAFGTTTANSNSNQTTRQGKSESTPLDFALLKARTRPVPNATPYDAQLPERYGEMVPKGVGDAFGAEWFSWGTVPEWVPPLGVR